MKALLPVLVLVCSSAFAQDDAGIAAQQATQQAVQQAQAVQQQMMNLTPPTVLPSVDDPFFPQPSGPIAGVADRPSFSASSGKLSSGAKISLHSSTHYATIYYTTDGWTPNANSPRYTGPITITGETHLQAIAVGPNLLRSAVARADYWTESSAGVQPPAFLEPLVVSGLLRAGTHLHLTTTTTISSKTAEVGDSVPLALDQDLRVGQVVVAAKGTPVEAVLVVADPAKHGISGDLVFDVRAIQIQGKSVSLTGREILEGGKGRGAPDAVIQPQMRLEAVVVEDTSLKPVPQAPAPSASADTHISVPEPVSGKHRFSEKATAEK